MCKDLDLEFTGTLSIHVHKLYFDFHEEESGLFLILP